ncbi:hypothetical protein LDJ79_00690 [Vibrio tritonius]|uniref:Polymerase nucleotidyl transferase domain-containing protein n=1 Tax=Vibrio tritonius TaxID=1435069 RepID=A0ABS7YG15_9VIBR|nr:hypothetical protein [Vibrio tritonius]MCA2014606.1 hypothetical protein [Vibrio tritonius]
MFLIKDNLHLPHLPLQAALIDSVCQSLVREKDVLAAVLVGSLAGKRGDRISDADIVIFTTNGFHKKMASTEYRIEFGKDIFYTIDGFHTPLAYFEKHIFYDFTSIEIHYLDLTEPFQLSNPYQVLFDKQSIISSRLTEEPAPKHEDFEVYTVGDDGLIWELFDCIKWLSRNDTELAKQYLKKLATKLESET